MPCFWSRSLYSCSLIQNGRPNGGRPSPSPRRLRRRGGGLVLLSEVGGGEPASPMVGGFSSPGGGSGRDGNWPERLVPRPKNSLTTMTGFSRVVSAGALVPGLAI